jgi:hypothetical protein
MVFGTEKSAQIADLPLLSWCADLLNQVLSAGEKREDVQLSK